jgi:hypothetical protein
MKRGIIIRFAVMAAIALTGLLLLRSSSTKPQPPSKESMDECCRKKCKAAEDNNMLWETFSRQFISVSN